MLFIISHSYDSQTTIHQGRKRLFTNIYNTKQNPEQKLTAMEKSLKYSEMMLIFNIHTHKKRHIYNGRPYTKYTQTFTDKKCIN